MKAVGGRTRVPWPRCAMTSARVGCASPVSSHARDMSTAGPPSHCQGMRKRVKVFVITGCCSAASAQVLPPSADTMTFVILPAPEYAMPEIS